MCALVSRAGRYSKGSGEDNPKRWKATFRCGLNSCNSARARTIVPQPTLDEECKRAHRPARVFLIVDDADYREWLHDSQRERERQVASGAGASSSSAASSGSSELVEAETGETKVGMRLKAAHLKRPLSDDAPGPQAKRHRTHARLSLSQSHSHSHAKQAAAGGRFQGIIIPSGSALPAPSASASAAIAEPAALPVFASERHFGNSLT